MAIIEYDSVYLNAFGTGSEAGVYLCIIFETLDDSNCMRVTHIRVKRTNTIRYDLGVIIAATPSNYWWTLLSVLSRLVPG